eukprot:TRINITY_DN19021_c0_g1_i2.p1 TRINITY_DN19021_c0_g1~~TRINITY_DN19021_c0_g1_i2.p1  ORF type:complete len:429 (-),score=39.59 TRINITY_DN19021_c0_g1_i2:46-1332(-)
MRNRGRLLTATLALARLLLFSFTSLALASNSSTCKVSRMNYPLRSHFKYQIPSGHRMTWSWDTYVAGSCLVFDGSTDVPLDFFTARGHDDVEKMNHVQASCKDCHHFSMNFTTYGWGELTMHVGVHNRRSHGRAAHIFFTVIEYNVQDCLSSVDTHLIIFSILLGLLLYFVAFFFHCAGWTFGVEGTREDAWDMLWTKHVCKSRQWPQRPRERMMPWALHAWVYTYPWNPWYEDPLNYSCRCLVLVADIFITFLTTAIYGFNKETWDRIYMTTYKNSIRHHDWVEADLLPVLLISGSAELLSVAICGTVVGIFRFGLNIFHTHTSRHLKAFGVAVSATTIATIGGVSLSFVLKHRSCRFVEKVMVHFVTAQLTRVPMSFLGVLGQYAALWYCGRPNVESEVIGEPSEQEARVSFEETNNDLILTISGS